MGSMGVFEASLHDEEAQQRTAAADSLAAAIYDAREKFGEFLGGATDVRDFRDRIALCKDDLIKTIEPHIFPRTGVVRRVAKQLEREFAQQKKADLGAPLEPEGDFHGYLDDVSGNDRAKVDENVFVGEGTPHTGDPADTDFAKQGTYNGYADQDAFHAALAEMAPAYIKDREEKLKKNPHGHDHEGCDHAYGICNAPEGFRFKGSRRQAGEHSVDQRYVPVRTRYPDPTQDPDSYSDAVADEHGVREQPALGKHRQPEHEAVEHFASWCRAKNTRPSLNTLDRYASRGLADRDYFAIASAIQRVAEAQHRLDEVGGSGRPAINPYTGDDSGAFKGNPEGHGHWDKDDRTPQKESRRVTAGGVECPQCGKYLATSEDRLGHSHEGGDVYDAAPQYGYESRGDWMGRGKGGLPPVEKRREAAVRTAAPDYLQKANEALTGLLNQEAETFQEQIAPMQQALQVVQQAMAEQQQANPFNVMPGGAINVMPGADQGGGGLPSQNPPPGAPMDPSMMGGDPSMGGGAPMDPSMMGDPSAGGAPPMDPSMMGGPPQDPSQQMTAKRGGRPKAPARKGSSVRLADVLKDWEEWNNKLLPKGNAPMGGDPDFEQFARETGTGQRAIQKLRQHLMGQGRTGSTKRAVIDDNDDYMISDIAPCRSEFDDIDLGNGWTQSGMEGDIRHPDHQETAWPAAGGRGYVVYHDHAGNRRSGPFPGHQQAIDYILSGGKPQHVFVPSDQGGSWKLGSYVDDLQASGENHPDQGIRDRFEKGHWERTKGEDDPEEKPKVRGAATKQACGNYDSFEACVADNQDKDDPSAFCGELEQRSKGKKGSAKQAWMGWGGGKPAQHKVAGWDFDDHLDAHVSTSPRVFTCSCGDAFDTPTGFHRCACGKSWNSYVIGTGGDRKEASAEKYLVREIPVRENVIVASKQDGDGDDWDEDDPDEILKHSPRQQKWNEQRAKDIALSKEVLGSRDDNFARFVADAYVARESAITKLTDPGEITETEDTGTPTMKPMPADWARRNPDGKWNSGPAKKGIQ